MPEKAMWQTIGAWDAVIAAKHHGRPGAGIVVEPMSGVGIASLIAAPGGHKAASEELHRKCGIGLPERPQAAHGQKFDVIWTGPEQWLAISPDPKLYADLSSTIETLALADQSGAHAVLRVSGPDVRKALAKGCSLDLDPRVFVAGTAATTSISLIGVNMWRLPDEDAIHISLFRSMAASFWSWLTASSAEWGLEVRGLSHNWQNRSGDKEIAI